MKIVFAVNQWPEADQKDFQITKVRGGESDEDAIKRAKSYYNENIECYIREVIEL